MISIIVPVYNAEKTFYRTMSSSLSQSFDGWECIIVDNNSSDNSVQVARSFTDSDSRFRMFRCEKQGVSFARNMGLDCVKGDYIWFLDSDDFFHRSSSELRKTSLEANEDAIGVCSDYLILTKGGNVKRKNGRKKLRSLVLTCSQLMKFLC
jgi:glycosyltransferase involved in cell wall biosynthesis